MFEALASFFQLIVQPCYQLTGSWWAAIFLFTLFSKVVLMPLSLWCQKNSIVMVQLMPDLFRIKTKYFGDRETIDEEQNKLYKEHHYHALLSLIPLAIQVIILFGLVDVIHSITDSGAPGTEYLGLVPATDGGTAWIMPFAAALSAVVMGGMSNLINPLQKEQSRTEKNMTNGISIALSFFLGVYVVCGMAFYWVCSNLLSILVQVLCNVIINPKKYVDYDDLNAARDEYNAMNDATKTEGGPLHRDPNAGRERTDYKRFMNVANKHLVFYSEGSGFYKYFRGAIEWLLANSNVRIHYITSDPNDQVFKIAEREPRLIPYCLGQRRLITCMMKMDADVVVTTLGNLDTYYIKRSYVRKDIEYVYMCHHMTSMPLTSTRTEYDNYDTVMCVGPHQHDELRALEAFYHTKRKNLPPVGYDLLDQEIADYEAGLGSEGRPARKPGEKPLVLIAPTWNYDNICDSCVDDMLDQLLGHGYRVVLRPHPEYLKRYRSRWDAIVERHQGVPESELRFEDDFSTSTSILSADVLITDWSSISCEFSFTTLRPCVFINTAMKVENPEWDQVCAQGICGQPTDITLRDQIGHSLDPKDLTTLPATIDEMLANPEAWSDRIREVRSQMIFNLGHGGEVAGEYLLDRLLQIEAQRGEGGDKDDKGSKDDKGNKDAQPAGEVRADA